MRPNRHRIIARGAAPKDPHRMGRLALGAACSGAALAAGLLVLASLGTGCGRAPSSLLRQGQLPLYDFPLYAIESGNSRVLKIKRAGGSNRSVLISGLSSPSAIVTDRYNNLYVSEQGTGKVLKVDVDSGDSDTLADNIDSPGPLAVDPSGDVFVVEENSNSVIRAKDGKLFAVYSSLPTGIAFGVDGVLVVSLSALGRVDWIRNPKALDSGTTASEFAAEADIVSKTGLDTPTNLGLDSMGRIYVAEDVIGIGRLLRYHQTSPGDGETLAEQVSAPKGIAVDPIGNTYVSVQASSAIDIITFDGDRYAGWAQSIAAPDGLAFTQY